MALFTVIVSEIMTLTSSRFKGWSIGVTQDRLDWSAYGDHVHSLQTWEAETLKIAETIKYVFTNLGMTECTASHPPLPGKQTYVYIFKK